MTQGSIGGRQADAVRVREPRLAQWLTPPVRRLVRQMAVGCVGLCLVLIGAEQGGLLAGAALTPAALVLGLWANLLSLLLLASRSRG